MRRNTLILLIGFLINSCAKIHIQCMILIENVINDCERMHVLNIVMMNKEFNEKRMKIDKFICTPQYTPQYIDEVSKQVSDGIIYKMKYPG